MYFLALLAEREKNNHYPDITPFDITWQLDSWLDTVKQFTCPIAPISYDVQFDRFVNFYWSYLTQLT